MYGQFYQPSSGPDWWVVAIAMVILAFCIMVIAKSKKRDIGLWFMYGLILPPVALTHILVLPEEGAKPCPRCAELAKAAAQVCPHCGHELPSEAALVVG